jgi:hypothetical protein
LKDGNNDNDISIFLGTKVELEQHNEVEETYVYFIDSLDDEGTDL